MAAHNFLDRILKHKVLEVATRKRQCPPETLRQQIAEAPSSRSLATVLAQEILEKFSSDNLEELKEAVAKHRDYTKNY